MSRTSPHPIARLASLALVLASWSPLQAQDVPRPNLALTRTRVVLEGRDLNSSLTIVNTGTAAGTFRVELLNKRMTDDGKLVAAGEPAPEDRFADALLRISPRRVVLEPGESQLLRILARIPPELAPGEYRSHLRVSLLPPDDPAESDSSAGQEQLRIALRSEIGFNIPVIVRHGDLDASLSLSGLAFAPGEDGIPRLSFTLHREGTRSVYGDLEVEFTSSQGRKHVVKKMGGIAVYTPNTMRRFSLALDVPDGVTVAHGTLTVTYREGDSAPRPRFAAGQLVLE